MRLCCVDGCGKPHKARDLCSTHYKTFQVHGDPLWKGRYSTRGPFLERFWAQVTKSDGCWVFTGVRTSSPYGRLVGPDGRALLAHRASWEIHNGPIPDGLVVCHHCDNPPCVRPEHLFLGTRPDNNQDMTEKGRHFWHAQRFCPNNHEYTRENTHIYRGRRQCRACSRLRHQRARARRMPSSSETLGS